MGKTRKNHIPRVGDFNEVKILILISLLANNPCPQALMSFPRAEKKFLLFTLGGVYRTNASGAKQILENITGLRIPTGQRQTSWPFTSMVEDLNLGVPRTNPASGQGGT